MYMHSFSQQISLYVHTTTYNQMHCFMLHVLQIANKKKNDVTIARSKLHCC